MNWKNNSIYLILALAMIQAEIFPAALAGQSKHHGRIAQKNSHSKNSGNNELNAENYGRNLAEADQLLLDGKFKQAEGAYRALIDSDQNGDALAGLAVALAKQPIPDKILEAEKVLKQARDKFEDNPNVLAAGGFVSYVHAKSVASPARRDLYLEAADSLCSKAVRDNPDIVIAQQTMGLCRLAQDQAEEAIEPLRKAASLDENAGNLTLLAQALLRVDPKDEEAGGLIDSALEKNPDYYPAIVQKAYVLTQKGKQEDAYMKLQSVPEAYRSPEWYMIAGDVCHKQGDGPAALAAWQEAIKRDPHNADAYRRLAEFYTLRGDGELAIAEMHNALEILPNDQTMRNQLAELALRQDKLDVAEAEYRTILAAAPDDAQGLLGLSRVYFRKARRDGQYPPDWQQLMEQLQNVVTEKSVRAQVIKSGAKSLQENIELSEAEKSLAKNHFRDARRHFATVINNHKDDAYGLLTLGEQAYNDGDLTAAQQAYDYAKEIPEVTPRAEQGLSKIITQRNEAARQTKLGDATHGLPDVAIDHYRQALIADPQYPSAYYGLYSMFGKSRRSDPQLAIANGLCFLEAADDSDKLRPEVEDNVSRLQKRISRSKER